MPELEVGSGSAFEEEAEADSGMDRFEISSPSSARRAIVFPTVMLDSFSSYCRTCVRYIDDNQLP